MSDYIRERRNRSTDLAEITEQIRAAVMKKAPDVSEAEITADHILDDSLMIIAVETFGGDRYTLTVEADK